MRTFFIKGLCTLLIGLWASSLWAANPKDIILTLPQEVIADATRAAVPLAIDAHSKSIQGDITIIDIRDLELTDQHLSCRLFLSGRKLAFTTEIAGHQIKLKVGSIDLDFTTDAEIRFDPEKQILLIKPVVREVSARTPDANGDIGQALVALLNGREFPVAIQKLDPIIARTGAKTLSFDTKITDIAVRPRIVELRLSPKITAK